MSGRQAADGLFPGLRTGPGAVCLLGLLAALSGCASQGPLHPPSLKLPAPVSGLAAERVAGAVDLHWTTPAKTTDGVPLAGKHGAGALVAEICRSETAAVATCAGGSRVAVKAGAPVDFHDVLPASLVSGSLRPLHYRVRVLNGAGKGAKYAAVDALAGTAPPPVQTLRASPVGNGVALRWQPEAAAGGARIVLRVERVGVAAAPGAPPPHPDLLAVEAPAVDPGGVIDTGAKPGIEQRYTVFRTETLQSGGKTLTATSPPAMVTVLASAKAPPPPPPSGLEGLVNTLAAPEIDLVWQPADGAAGYLVFRAEGDGAPVPLTPQPVTGLSYADAAVRPGVRYRYAVASVDASGTAGPHGPERVESVPQP